MKRFIRVALYVGFGLLCAALAWTFYDVNTLMGLAKVGVGGTAIMIVIDYFM